MCEISEYHYLSTRGTSKFVHIRSDGQIYDENWNIINSFKNRTGYLMVRFGNKNKYIHRLVAISMIANLDNKKYVDHINHNKLDNRMENLRWCTGTENNRNNGKSCKNTSGVKGVHWHIRSQKWQASVRIGDKKKYLGSFDNILDAKKAYQDKAKEIFGEFYYDDTDSDHSINNDL